MPLFRTKTGLSPEARLREIQAHIAMKEKAAGGGGDATPRGGVGERARHFAIGSPSTIHPSGWESDVTVQGLLADLARERKDRESEARQQQADRAAETETSFKMMQGMMEQMRLDREVQ